jgi:hypothetical protein
VDAAKYKADVARYEGEKGGIKKEAEKYEHESDVWNAESERALHSHHQWALATTAEQIAISLAAIALLTRRRWLLRVTYVVAIIGFVLGAFAGLHVDPIGAMMASGPSTHQAGHSAAH